jgi:hypothetical protein
VCVWKAKCGFVVQVAAGGGGESPYMRERAYDIICAAAAPRLLHSHVKSHATHTVPQTCALGTHFIDPLRRSLSHTHTCTSGTTTRDESHMPESWTLMRCVCILFCVLQEEKCGCVSFEGRLGGGKMKRSGPVAK